MLKPGLTLEWEMRKDLPNSVRIGPVSSRLSLVCPFGGSLRTSASERPGGAPRLGSKALDQSLRPVELCKASLDILQPGIVRFRSVSPQRALRFPHSLTRECHWRCRPISCFQVTRTSSGAASRPAPRPSRS